MTGLSYTHKSLFEDIIREGYSVTPKVRRIAEHCIMNKYLSRVFFDKVCKLSTIDMQKYINEYLGGL